MSELRPRVLMVGPDPSGRGGMATVTQLVLAHASSAARLRFVPTHRDGSVPLRLWLWLRGSAVVSALLVSGRVDVLHLHVAERGSVVRKVLLVLVSRLASTPVLLHCHGAELVSTHRRLPRPVQAAVAWAFRRADALVVLGESWRSVYVSLLGVKPANVMVLRNPVNLPETLPDRDGRSTVGMLFLGRFGHRKGSDDLLDAVAALPASVRARLRLRMAGDGPVAATVRTANQVGADVQVSGWLGPAARDEALAAADVFILPSREEGLPMALLEAMAWGVVPIATPVGAIPEVVSDGHNGLFVEPGNVPEISAALHRLVCDSALRHKLSAGARASVVDLGIDGYVQALAALWRQLNRASRRPGG